MFKWFSNKDQVKTERPKGNAIFIGCFPKSGSTYLTAIFSNYTGYKKENFVHAWGAREQEWEPSILNKLAYENVIVQQHTRASDATLRLIKLHRIKTLILVRNIYDVIPSLRDHILKDPRPQPVFDAGENFEKKGSAEQLEMIVDLGIQWYFHFYVSWFKVCKSNEIRMISYEKYFQNEENEFQNLCEYFGIEFNRNKYLNARELTLNGQARFNVGITGRGKELLNKDQILTINKMALHYPEVDFSLIGIN